jgi:hypothetical protein
MAKGDSSDGPKKPWYRALTISISAFIMSLTATLIGAFSALKGPEIVVMPPKSVIIYRDGEGTQAVLNVIMPLDFINTAGNYGDVLIGANAGGADRKAAFDYQGLTKAVFTDRADEESKRCAIGSRCIALPGLLVIEAGESLVDIGGGAAKSLDLSFPVTQSNCTEGKACNGYGDFDHALARINTKPFEVRVTLKFHADGSREVVCTADDLHADYLKQVGWVALPCKSAKVSGEPFF